jgi:hypothetical protein
MPADPHGMAAFLLVAVTEGLDSFQSVRSTNHSCRPRRSRLRQISVAFRRCAAEVKRE